MTEEEWAATVVGAWNDYVGSEAKLIESLERAHFRQGGSWRAIGSVLNLSHNTLRRWVAKGRVGR